MTLFLWQISFVNSILAPVTLILGASFAIAYSGSQLVAGVSFVLWTASYDIGDRIRVVGVDLPVMLVKAIGPMTTTFGTIFGETVSIANHILAQKALVNHTRSPVAYLKVKVTLATRTPPSDITKLAKALAKYVESRPDEWVQAFLFFTDIDHRRGTIDLDVWLGSTASFQEWLPLYTARSRALLFIHAYISEAGLHFVHPPLPCISYDSELPPQAPMVRPQRAPNYDEDPSLRSRHAD